MYYTLMDLLTKKAQLGLNAALFIAYNASKEAPISGATIAEHYNLSSRALEPILQTLGHAGLLQSIKGHSGGYYIKEPDKISIKNIAQCFTCKPTSGNVAFSEFSSILKHSLEESQERFWDKLSKITIKDLYEESKKENIPRLSSKIITFEI
ncbi:MAG: hypothetical protein COA45_10885 [Zetaproteobacteria bacterium]|nr:MAG: hypothetical protein COA45_10885 [Zetaproteobacteria bacterium]